MKKIGIIIGIILIAGVIMYFVSKQNKATTQEPGAPIVISARAQQIVDKLPYATRKKIVGAYSWYVANGDTIILKDGKVFNVTKNEFDPHGHTSIERFRLDGVLWDAKTNYGLIDASTEWWLGHTKIFTLAEFQESLKVQ